MICEFAGEDYANNAEFVKEPSERSLLDFRLLLEPLDITKYNYIFA